MIVANDKPRIFLSFGLLVLLILIPIVVAQIEYPVSELGDCASRVECEAYCDNPENIENCLNFAEENNLMSAEEIGKARKMIQFLNSGETPGGCQSKEECEAYCDNEEHIEECVTFAERAGFVSKEEAEMARRTGGKGPGGCTGKEECEAYCNQEENFEECIEFAREHGLMSEEEAERARNMGRSGPGGCSSEEECNVYCESHGLECFKFAQEHGLIDESQFSEEQLCMINCLVESGVDPSACEEGNREQMPACMACGEKCMEMPETKQ
jgi:hypothetical protein